MCTCYTILDDNNGWRGCPGPEERGGAAFGVAKTCAYYMRMTYIHIFCVFCTYYEGNIDSILMY